jgi:hypothetical protein
MEASLLFYFILLYFPVYFHHVPRLQAFYFYLFVDGKFVLFVSCAEYFYFFC